MKRRHQEIRICSNVCTVSFHPYHHNSWALASSTISNRITICFGCFSCFFTCFLSTESWLCAMGFSLAGILIQIFFSQMFHLLYIYSGRTKLGDMPFTYGVESADAWDARLSHRSRLHSLRLAAQKLLALLQGQTLSVELSEDYC